MLSKMRFKHLVFTFALLCSISIYGQIDRNSIEEAVEKDMKDSQTPGAVVAVLKDGKFLFHESFGVKTAGTKDSVKISTLFLTASVTKTITTAAFLKKCQELGIQPSDSIGLLLKDLPSPLSKLSIHHMLSQSSGIIDHWPERDKYKNDPKAYFERFGKKLVAEDLLDVFSYTNFGHVLAGYAFTEMTQQNFKDAIRESLLQPLAMNQTLHDFNVVEYLDHSDAHRSGEKLKHEYIFPLIQPSASMFSTANDLMKFAQCFMQNGVYEGKQVLPPKVIDQMSGKYTYIGSASNYFGYPSSYYGYGLMSFEFGGIKFVGHPGETTSQNALLAMAPEEKLAIVILSNSGFHPFIHTFETIVNSLYPQHTKAVSPVITDIDPEQYSGSYVVPAVNNSDSKRYYISKRKNQLFLQLSPDEIVRLEPVSRDLFSYRSENFDFPVEVIFYRNDDNEVTHMNHFWTTASKRVKKKKK